MDFQTILLYVPEIVYVQSHPSVNRLRKGYSSLMPRTENFRNTFAVNVHRYSSYDIGGGVLHKLYTERIRLKAQNLTLK